MDFIFGGATAYFYDCEMKSVEPGYIFAPSTPEHVKTGFVVRNCSFTRSDNVPDESVYIARPWREHARLTIENCSMDKHINPAYFHSFRDPESETEETDKKLSGYLKFLMEHSTPDFPYWEKEKIASGKKSKWNYTGGCVIAAILSMYKSTQDKSYLDFADSFIGYYVNDDGTIKTYDPGENNLDNINAGKNLFTLYDLTGKEKYRRAMDTIRGQLDHMPRTEAGNFWHKEIYPYQVWLDGLYMAQPYYMEYERRYRKNEGAKDIINQFKNVR